MKLTKQSQLEAHLKRGFWIDPMGALKMFGISPSGYHRTLYEIKQKHPEWVVVSETIKTNGTWFKKHKAYKKGKVPKCYQEAA